MSNSSTRTSSSRRSRRIEEIEENALYVINKVLNDRNIVDLFHAEDGAQVLSVLQQYENDAKAAAEQLLFTRAIAASSAGVETTSQNNNVSAIPIPNNATYQSTKSADGGDKKSHVPFHYPTPAPASAPPTLLNGGTSVVKNNEMSSLTPRSSSSSPTSTLEEDLFKSSSNEDESKVKNKFIPLQISENPTTKRQRISGDENGSSSTCVTTETAANDNTTQGGISAFKYRPTSQHSKFKLHQITFVPNASVLPLRYREKDNSKENAEKSAIARGKTPLGACAKGPQQGLLRCITDAEKKSAVSAGQFVPKYTDEEYNPNDNGPDIKCTVCGKELKCKLDGYSVHALVKHANRAGCKGKKGPVPNIQANYGRGKKLCRCDGCDSKRASELKFKGFCNKHSTLWGNLCADTAPFGFVGKK